MRRALLTAFLFATLATSAHADPQTAATLRDKALTDPTAYDLLESLTTEIGPRPVGSPAAMAARDWGIAKLKALGFKNVHAEEFAKPSWHRDDESAEITAPHAQKLAILGLGRSISTPPEGIEAEVVVLKSLGELMAAPPDAFKGKIVVVNQPMARTQTGLGYGVAVQARSAASEAAKRGAVAYLTRSIATGTGRAPHTGSTRYRDPNFQIPAAALGVPDADLLARLAARGPVRMHLKLLNHTDADSKAWNVSGEITGSEAPNEVIVIGGHMDSWDPGTGAIDDGAGVAITTAAAKLIGDLKKHPPRTIRVVMWGSEEQDGSEKAYYDAHKDELANIVAASESDFGADNVYSIQLPTNTLTDPQLSPLVYLLAPLHVATSPEPSKQGGSDISGLQVAGVPVFTINQDGSRYFDYHHSADDTLAIVDPVQLNQNVATWATMLYMIANSDVDFRKGAAPPSTPK
ncbi:MAG TPA: M28 family peptidase [Rhizomicrobium sp.]|nr:M28 family peptidase [Rhizomicrobium sp.]